MRPWMARGLRGLGIAGLTLAWACTAGGSLLTFWGGSRGSSELALAVGLIGGAVALVPLVTGRWRLRACFEALVLVALPVWGWFINHRLPDCSACDPGFTNFRLLAEPGIYGLYLAYGLSAAVYLHSRRRAVTAHPGQQRWILSALAAGFLLLLPVVVQFQLLPILGLIFPFVGLPLIAPLAVVTLYAMEYDRRAELAHPDGLARPQLGSIIGRSALLLGLYTLLQAVIHRDPRGAALVFTQTCKATLSQMTAVPCPSDGDHYLCTVAARGHPWLVRPLRVGTRRGAPILVNRQLAVANAFEDLLHERWPDFGRASRSTYDALGLPVSRLIRGRWAADLVYLAMKPAEWAFLLALRLADPGDPETRIDRMYR